MTVLLSFNSSAAAKSLQSCPTLCDRRDGSPPGYPILGILQARTLEWVAISFSPYAKELRWTGRSLFTPDQAPQIPLNF